MLQQSILNLKKKNQDRQRRVYYVVKNGFHTLHVTLLRHVHGTVVLDSR